MSRVARCLALLAVASVAAPTLAGCGDSTKSDGPGIVTQVITGINDRGLHSECKAAVSTIDVALEADYAMNGHYASTIGELVAGGFLHANSVISASTGTSYTVTSAVGSYTVALTVPMNDQSTMASGTIGGQPC